MDLLVEQGCPQCGAPVSLGESDRFFFCPFCNIRSFIVSSGVPRYMLPLKKDFSDVDLFWLPYIRFKGSVFLVNSSCISHRIVDTTGLGFSCKAMPPTLGFRPQAMKIKRVTAQMPGRYLPLSFKVQSIFKKAARLSDQVGLAGAAMLHRAYVGESLSFIYLPVRKDKNVLYDGVTDSPLPGDVGDIFSGERGRPFQVGWQPYFLSSLCPQCAWELDGEGSVATCSNCNTAWQITARGLEQVAWQMAKSADKDAAWLPFWRIKALIPPLNITRFSDFLRLTNQHLKDYDKGGGQAMSFWIPAFKIRPKIFLQTAKRMTLSQCVLELEDVHLMKRRYPVTLPASEARQALKITLAAAARKKEVYSLLPSIRFTNVSPALVHLPFRHDSHDFVQEQTGVTIGKNVLEWGRML